MVSKKYSCSVCNELIRACKRNGKGNYCKRVLDSMYDGKITSDKAIDKIRNKLGKKTFEKEFG